MCVSCLANAVEFVAAQEHVALRHLALQLALVLGAFYFVVRARAQFNRRDVHVVLAGLHGEHWRCVCVRVCVCVGATEWI